MSKPSAKIPGHFIGHREFRIIAKLMQKVHLPNFPRFLRYFINAKIPISTFLIVKFIPNRPIVPIYHWIPDENLRMVYEKQYLGGAYQLDPYFQYSQKKFNSGLYRLSEIAPDRYFSSEYNQYYYKQTRLIDELGILTPLSDGSVVHFSFSRDISDQKFSRRELKNLQEFSPILIELTRQHCETILQKGAQANLAISDKKPLETTLMDYSKQNFTKSLTRREAQITALVLQGHSSLSISLILEISIETVKVHRKNIYRKLQISTQAELFAKLSDAFNL